MRTIDIEVEFVIYILLLREASNTREVTYLFPYLF